MLFRSLQERINPLQNQIKEITEMTFSVGPGNIIFELVDYNPVIEKFNLSCKINGVNFSGLLPIPKPKARTFYKNPDLLIPKATLKVAENGLLQKGIISFSVAIGDTYETEVFLTIKDDYLEMEMIYVPSGCYEMGCGPWSGKCDDDEKPLHTVCVNAFYLGRYEVTQGQWKRVMGNNPSNFKRCGDQCPVEDVSWYDVQEFIKRLNRKTGKKYRLPTEAEWEYAARSGGRKEKYAGGDNVDALAWSEHKSGESTHQVGTKLPNGLGIYDMSGNVWEWCQDVYFKYAYQKHDLNNPVFEEEGSNRVSRGGSWYVNPRYVRAAFRNRYAPGCTYYYLGFRLCLPRVR